MVAYGGFEVVKILCKSDMKPAMIIMDQRMNAKSGSEATEEWEVINSYMTVVHIMTNGH